MGDPNGVNTATEVKTENCAQIVLLSWGINYEFQGPSLHRVAEIKIPNWLTLELLLFLADLSAGWFTAGAGAVGEERRGESRCNCEA